MDRSLDGGVCCVLGMHLLCFFQSIQSCRRTEREDACVFLCVHYLIFFVFVLFSSRFGRFLVFREGGGGSGGGEKKKLHSFCISDQDIQMTPLFFLFFCLLVRVFSSLLSIIFFCLFFFFPARHINTSSREFVDDKTRMDKTNTRI